MLAMSTSAAAPPNAETPVRDAPPNAEASDPSAKDPPATYATTHTPSPPTDMALPAMPKKSQAVAAVLPISGLIGGIGLVVVADQVLDVGFNPRHPVAAGVVAWTGIAVSAIAPSLGQIYAGNAWNTGLKARMVGAAMIASGLILSSTSPQSPSGRYENRGIAGVVIAIGGAVPFIGGSIHEIVTAPRAARRNNQRAAKRSISVVPVAVGAELGLSVSGSF